MIDINNITFGYGRRRKPVLSDFSLSIDAGGIYGLLGRNGAGKSTLLYLIAGLLSPQKGSITVAGADPRLRRPSTLADIFIVPEEFSLPSLRMEEFVRINKPFLSEFQCGGSETSSDNFRDGSGDAPRVVVDGTEEESIHVLRAGVQYAAVAARRAYQWS